MIAKPVHCRFNIARRVIAAAVFCFGAAVSGVSDAAPSTDTPPVPSTNNDTISISCWQKELHALPQREKLYYRLMSIYFSEEMDFSNPQLSALIRMLTVETRRMDPEHEGIQFVMGKNRLGDAEPNGRFTNSSAAVAEGMHLGDVKINLDAALKNIRLWDVLQTVVSNADQPIQFVLSNDGVEFRFRTDAAEMFTRTFQFDTNKLYQAADPQIAVETQITNLLNIMGVGLLPPASAVFDPGAGILTVRMTAEDLAIVRTVVETLNAAPEITVKVKFAEVQPDFIEGLDWHPNYDFGNSNNPFFGLLEPQQLDEALAAIGRNKGATLVGEYATNILGGCEATVLMSEGMTNSYGDHFKKKEFTLCLRPSVAGGGQTVQMKLTPIWNEPLRCAKTAHAGPLRDKDGGAPITTLSMILPPGRCKSEIKDFTVWEGQTVVVGNVRDDACLPGADGDWDVKGFAENKTRLLVFVTPTVVDSAGNSGFASRAH